MSVSRRLPVTLRYEYSALSAGWEQLHDAGLTLILVRVLLLVFLFLGSRGSPLPSSLSRLPSFLRLNKFGRRINTFIKSGSDDDHC